MPDEARTTAVSRPPEVTDADTRGAQAAVLDRLQQALTREYELLGLSKPPSTTHTDPVELVKALPIKGNRDRLAVELADSVRNLALARAANRNPPAYDPEAPLYRQEQLIVDGHPLHPCCRTRLGFTEADNLAYAPEHHPVVPIALVEVPADRWVGTGPPVLPMHPWQLRRVRDEFPWLKPTGRVIPAHPLMSLRTLATKGYHLKTAVDVQMTSAVRIVSPAAIHNGPTLSRLLGGLARGLTVLAEPEAGAALVDGEPARRLAYLRREEPRPNRGETVVPLAVVNLLAVPLSLGYAQGPAQLLSDAARLLIGPAMRLLHDGVALEAHGQNTLVGLKDGRPVRMYYRDLGGVRVSPWRLRRAGVDPPEIRGDLVSDEPEVLRTKLYASLVSTVVGELVAVLARAYDLEPERLAEVASAAAREAVADLPASARGDVEALFAPTAPVKAMVAMRLADDPLVDQWVEVPNPLAVGR